MQPLCAEIITQEVQAQAGNEADRRRQGRRTLRLGVPTYLDRLASRAIIHNLSETGLMVQTNAELTIGDYFEVELPEVGQVGARVVWSLEDRYGCAFEQPVPKAAVSASLLRSPAQGIPEQELFERGVELPAESPRKAPEPAGLLATEFSLLMLLAVVTMFVFALTALPISGLQW